MNLVRLHKTCQRQSVLVSRELGGRGPPGLILLVALVVGRQCTIAH